MADAIHLFDAVPDKNHPGYKTDVPWDETESAKELDFDLSRHAVQIGGIFAEAASAEELQLVQRLFFLPLNQAPRVAVFCSVGPRDGAAYVCTRAAEILASQTREAVCLVDANLRDPQLHHRYDLDVAPQEARPNSQVEKNAPTCNGGRGLWVLPASALRESCPELPLDWVRERLSRLRKTFGFVLICAPSLGSAADGFLLGQISDGVVLILEARATDRGAAVKTRQLLDAYNIRLLGAVMNQHGAPDSEKRHWKVSNRKNSKSL